MSEVKQECVFSSGIDESITCSKDGVFDDLGYPVNPCDKFPCVEITALTREEKKRERRLRKAAPKMYEALDAARVALELTKLGQARAWNHIYDAIKAALAEAGGRE